MTLKMKKRLFSRTLIATSLIALAATACSDAPAPSASPQVVKAPLPPPPPPPAPTGIQVEKELQYDTVPSPAQTAMALTLANQLMVQGKLEEAEARYKVAAAGGNAEAEKRLVKLRTEISAKALVDSAREKIQYGDYESARVSLRQVPANSMLRKSADALEAQIKEKEAAMQRALEASIQQGLNQGAADAPSAADGDGE